MYRALLEGDGDDDSSKKSGKSLQESRKVEQALRSHGVKVSNAAIAAVITNSGGGNAVVASRGGLPFTSRKERKEEVNSSGVRAMKHESAPASFSYSARGYSRTSASADVVASSTSLLDFPSMAVKPSEAPNPPIPLLSSSLPATPRSTTTATTTGVDDTAAAALGAVPAPAPQPVLYSWLPALAASTRLSLSGAGGIAGGGATNSSAPSSGVRGGRSSLLAGMGGAGIGMRSPIRYVRPQSLTSNPKNVPPPPPQSESDKDKAGTKGSNEFSSNKNEEEEQENLQRKRSSCQTVAPSSAIISPMAAASGNNRVSTVLSSSPFRFFSTARFAAGRYRIRVNHF